jgi:lipopolysaccharide biosynthesis glycosyltransferase
MRVYIGYDERERQAYRVAWHSLARRSGIEATPLDIRKLESSGLLRRPTDRRGGIYDLPSNAPCSTDFAISRFLVPLLAQSGWALFTDCDVVFLADARELKQLCDDRYAVMVVKHDQKGGGTKMDGQAQLSYPRKNWSSVMLINCDHPANKRLSLDDVNHRRGFDLHQFYWLNDSEIGELPPEWNWLVGVQPMPADPKIAHFTLGGPFTTDWRGGPYDEIWTDEYARLTHADRNVGSIR